MPTLLEDLTSGDSHRIWASSSEVVTSRDEGTLNFLAAQLPEIRAATEGLALGGYFYSNNVRLDFALRKLEFIKNKSGCLCLLYPGYDLYNPDKEQEAGNVQILERTDDAATWVSTYRCQCTVCGRRYHVESAEYHFTWWKWKVLL